MTPFKTAKSWSFCCINMNNLVNLGPEGVREAGWDVVQADGSSLSRATC